jgi:quinol monooxygenase YgiN
MGSGVVHIPWYATLFRGDKFEAALEEIAPVALRYGATEYAIYRSRDDQYRFLQLATFEDKHEFEAYWYGADFNDWRARYASWYQVPVLYVWNDLVARGGLGAPAEVEA